MPDKEAIDMLSQMIKIMWDERAVRQANEAFVPRSKNPFLRRMQRVIHLMQRPHALESLFGIHRAIVIDTRDPLKFGRVKVYAPVIHTDVKEQDLSFVHRCEFWGSLEDQGSTFVPPAGSMVFVEFEAGDREHPVVLGCLWPMTRTIDALDEGGFLMLEERERWGGSPGIRADGKNANTNSDMKALMPPWNNESYNGKDHSTNERSAIPHIYGIKSPEKHFLQMDDGNFDEGLKGKRVVLQSSRGSVLYMKDDEINTSSTLYQHKYWDDFRDAYPGLGYSEDITPYNKHKIELLNTGVQLQSFGGGRVIISDELEKNMGVNNGWQKPFDPGEMFRSFICIQSITEHKILLRDNEWATNNRSQTDGIFCISATGHYIGLEEQTIGGVAGPFRRIYIHSTSNHSIEMNDFTAQIASPYRKGDQSTGWSPGNYKSNAWAAFFKLKSGWGQAIELNDFGSQQENAHQYIMIRNENKELKPDCHPWPAWNYIRMNCVDEDKTFILWAAGLFRLHICHDALRQVHMGHDMVIVQKGAKYTEVNRYWFCRAQESIVFWSVNDRIRLLAGETDNEGNMKLREWPVVLATDSGFQASEHVFGSE